MKGDGIVGSSHEEDDDVVTVDTLRRLLFVEFLTNAVKRIKKRTKKITENFLTTYFLNFQFLINSQIFYKYQFQNHKNYLSLLHI